MSARWTGSERVLTATLAAIAALTFFLPLFSIHLPMLGDEEVTGYDTAAKIRQLTEQVRSLTGHGQSGSSPRLPRLPSTGAGGASGEPSTLPASIRFSWLIPVLIIAAFAGAVLTLLGSLVSLTLARIASAAGAVSGLLALLHLWLMDSDIHQALQESIQKGIGGGKGGFLAGLAQAVGNAVVGAFSLRPGAALFVLTGALGVAVLLAYTRPLSRTGSA
ncbi:MAG TPA: hypothetical protein VKU44_03575 [Terriglobia bacterium]|nr:hypothetical protein [Terriglobia bacterium]